MKKPGMKALAALLCAAFLLVPASFSAAAADADLAAAKETAEQLTAWLNEETPLPADGEIDSNADWIAFACARSGLRYGRVFIYSSYASGAVASHFDELYLTDIARIALAVGACGGDASSVGGYDLTAEIALADFGSQTYTSGIVYPLLALGSLDYGQEEAKQQLLTILLAAQRPDGGFNYLLKADPGNTYSLDGDLDSTAMALQALAAYAGTAEVDAVISQALAFVKAGQKESGGFGGAWGESADTTAQALTALCALGIDPLADEFVKNGNTIVDALLAYRNADGGISGWDGNSNVMSSYQALYALSAYIRFAQGDCALFDFADVETFTEEPTTGSEETTVEGTTGEDVTAVDEENLIPQTGAAGKAGAMVFALSAAATAGAFALRKKDE